MDWRLAGPRTRSSAEVRTHAGKAVSGRQLIVSAILHTCSCTRALADPQARADQLKCSLAAPIRHCKKKISAFGVDRTSCCALPNSILARHRSTLLAATWNPQRISAMPGRFSRRRTVASIRSLQRHFTGSPPDSTRDRRIPPARNGRHVCLSPVQVTMAIYCRRSPSWSLVPCESSCSRRTLGCPRLASDPVVPSPISATR